jgi:hypothetical protein
VDLVLKMRGNVLNVDKPKSLALLIPTMTMMKIKKYKLFHLDNNSENRLRVVPLPEEEYLKRSYISFFLV